MCVCVCVCVCERERERERAMATLEVSEPVGLKKPCPFCGKLFIKVGSHLAHCVERQGRDYSAYLSEKTLKNKSKATRKSCPKCHRMFIRLDTHLKNSATCKSVSDGPSLSEQTSPEQSPRPIPRVPIATPSHLTCYSQPARSPEINRLPLDILKLPTSQQGWDEADAFLKDQLVPAVLHATCPEDKNRVLSEGIYNYFAEKYGTRKQKSNRRQGKRAEP